MTYPLDKVHLLKQVEKLRPKVFRVWQTHSGKTYLYCFVEGTGHRLSYQREEDWIEV